MPPKSQKNSVSIDIDDGSLHLIECLGVDKCNRCVVWTQVWLPKEILRDFLTRPFHCGFCSAKQAAKVFEVLKPNLLRTPTGAFHADVLEQYGRRDNIQISVFVEEQNKDVYQKVANVADRIEVTIDKTDISVCHSFPPRRNGPKGINRKLVRRKTKRLIMGNQKKLKKMGQQLFINDDVAPLRGKVTYLTRQKEEMASLTTVNEKIIMCLKSSDKLVFNTLFEVDEWDTSLFHKCINKHF